MLTMFYTYFNTQLNFLGKEYALAYQEIGVNPMQGGINAAWLSFMGLVVPAIVGDAIMSAGSMMVASKQVKQQEDTDNGVPFLLNHTVGAMARYTLPMVPTAGPIMQDLLATAFASKGSVYKGARVAPAFDMAMQHTYGLAKGASDILNDHKVNNTKMAMDALYLVGLATQLPVGAAVRYQHLLDDDTSSARTKGL